MFERLTDRTRRVLVLAQEEAKLAKSSEIGSDHLLAGLIAEDGGVAHVVLAEQGLTLDIVREQMVRTDDTLSESIPFSTRAKKILEYSLREALGLGHNYIGTEHLLLAVLRDSDGAGCAILVRAGISLDAVRGAVIRTLAGYAQVEQQAKLDKRQFRAEAPFAECPLCSALVPNMPASVDRHADSHAPKPKPTAYTSADFVLRVESESETVAQLLHLTYLVLREVHNTADWESPYYAGASELWDRLGEFMYPDS